MKIFEYINEVSTPTGTVFIRFRDKAIDKKMVGDKVRYTYALSAFAGFANAPEELRQSEALRNYSINTAQDLVNMIQSIFKDKVFISAQRVIIYDDLTNDMLGDSTPVYRRNPYLLKFFKWVEREGGDKIQIVDKVSKEGPEKVKKPSKGNPMKGMKIRDIPQGETKRTTTFTVSPQFYREIQNNLPNIMKYRGPNHTFIMPNEVFMAFRKQAEEKFPFADIKVQHDIATGEGVNLNEEGDYGPYSRGVADGYYGRPYNPHKLVRNAQGKMDKIELSDPAEIDEYKAGYYDEDFGSKEYGASTRPEKVGHIAVEDITDESGPASRSLCRSKKPDSALGASNLSSCISQGLRAHKSGRADYVGGKKLKVNGKKIKGKKYGGPLPDYS